MNDVVDEGLDVIHRATDPRNAKTRSYFASTVIALLLGNGAISGFDTFIESPDVEYKSIMDSVAVLSSTFGTHINDSEAVFITQEATNTEVVNSLVDLMDTINYIDLKNEVNDVVAQLEGKIYDGNAQISTLTLDMARAKENLNLSADLESIYNSNIDSLASQIRMWNQEITRKKRSLAN
mgnify:CR=1 FL=1|tara:strand:+ start:7637 stop:8176 length:540 start_codon:yes stop_codon:yes gene_type:complete